MAVSWSEFAAAAPELSERIAARFAANTHHVLGTIRSDGTPRLNGTEAPIAEGQVRIGMMLRSRKLDDVRRDPRVELHSAPLEDDLAEGDARLSGRLVETAPWVEIDDGAFHELLIDRATLIRVDGEELVVDMWTPATGERQIRRR